MGNMNEKYKWTITEIMNYHSIQAQTVIAIWNFYGASILAVFAFVVAARTIIADNSIMRWLIIIGFAIFIVTNLALLKNIQNRLYLVSVELLEITDESNFKTSKFQKLWKHHTIINPQPILWVHGIIDSITLIILYLLTS